MKRAKKRTLSLLEVLIAFTLIVLAIFPLIAPHVAMVRQEQAMTRQVELNQFASLLYGAVLINFYNQAYSLEEIQKAEKVGVTLPIDEKLVEKVGLTKVPHQGSINLKMVRRAKESKTEGAYLIALTIAFPGNESRWNYRINVYRTFGTQQEEEQ